MFGPLDNEVFTRDANASATLAATDQDLAPASAPAGGGHEDVITGGHSLSTFDPQLLQLADARVKNTASDGGGGGGGGQHLAPGQAMHLQPGAKVSFSLVGETPTPVAQMGMSIDQSGQPSVNFSAGEVVVVDAEFDPTTGVGTYTVGLGGKLGVVDVQASIGGNTDGDFVISVSGDLFGVGVELEVDLPPMPAPRSNQSSVPNYPNDGTQATAAGAMNGYPSSEGGNRDYDAQSGQFVDRSTNPWQVIEPQSGKPVAGWTVDPQTHQVSVNGQPLPP